MKAIVNDAQIESFQRDGFVVVPGLIERTVVDEWKRQVQRELGVETEDAIAKSVQARWPASDGTSVLQNFRFRDGFDFHRVEGVVAAIDQFGGGNFSPREGDSNPHVLWPVPTDRWQVATSGHVDGYAGSRWFSFMIGATTYLPGVGPREGGTFLWPGSHIDNWLYYRAHPDAVGNGEDEARDTAFQQRARKRTPVEAVMDAGDVLFWHHNLYHSPSKNIGQRPRWGFFIRCHHNREAEIRHEAPEDLWRFWGSAGPHPES